MAGIDVGGTYTDLVLFARGADGGEVRFAKVPTTQPNQAVGVVSAIAAAGVAPADLDLVIHGTTATTNAILERKVAKVGLITTAAFAIRWSSAAARGRSPTGCSARSSR